MLVRGGVGHRTEANMGDKSPKSKQRDQKQKEAHKRQNLAKAKAKQGQQASPKDKK
jgi:hypothetical protein